MMMPPILLAGQIYDVECTTELEACPCAGWRLSNGIPNWRARKGLHAHVSNARSCPRKREAAPTRGGGSRPGDGAEANGNTVGFCRAFGGPTFRRNPSLSVSTGTTRGGLSVSILQRRRWVSNEFPYEVRAWTPIDRVSQNAHSLEQWPRGESNSHVLPDTGS